MFGHSYFGKKVVITGHTGFKGSWLSIWLNMLGAEIFGISTGPPTRPSMFNELGLAEFFVEDHLCDIVEIDRLSQTISEIKPDIVFHLAAQAIVSTGFEQPLLTLNTNIIGTANIIEAVRQANHRCALVLITSDKAYENVEQVWGYRENDRLGGKDIYSGSKGAAELIIRSYFETFFASGESFVSLASARAGNVIGGGDWSKDRILVDAAKSWSNEKPVTIRNPHATRPWQHVLEPLSGYLLLGQRLLEKHENIRGESFNFGPPAEQVKTVERLLEDFANAWSSKKMDNYVVQTWEQKFQESQLLKLNCDKALHLLSWEPTLTYQETVALTANWYSTYYSGSEEMKVFTVEQIKLYQKLGSQRGRQWTN